MKLLKVKCENTNAKCVNGEKNMTHFQGFEQLEISENATNISTPVLHVDKCSPRHQIALDQPWGDGVLQCLGRQVLSSPKGVGVGTLSTRPKPISKGPSTHVPLPLVDQQSTAIPLPPISQIPGKIV